LRGLLGENPPYAPTEVLLKFATSALEKLQKFALKFTGT
jgi:hypothetical protein